MARHGLSGLDHPDAQGRRNCTDSGQNCWSDGVQKILEKLLESMPAKLQRWVAFSL